MNEKDMIQFSKFLRGTKWEYKVVGEWVERGAQAKEVRDKLGEEGWELVAVTGGEYRTSYYKRPIMEGK